MDDNQDKQKELENIEEIEVDSVHKGKDHVIIYASIFLVLLFFSIFFLPKLIVPSGELSLDELHSRNLEGKLSPDKGYVYNGLYSFVLFDGLWYTQLVTSGGATQYNIPFHHGPKEVENISIYGQLNYSNLDKYKNFFMTFDPDDDDLSYIAASTSESNFVFIQVFGKGVIGSCTKNATGCEDRPKVKCNSTSAPVFYFGSEDETNVLYIDNCVIIAGKERELFKATDRMLFDLLGIME